MGGLQHFWEQGDLITRGVAVLLLLMSVSAWVLIVWKGWLLRRVRSDIARAVPAPVFMRPPLGSASSCRYGLVMFRM